MFACYRKSGSLNLFSVTNLWLEVELMYLLRIRWHCRHKNRRKWCRAPEMTASLYRKTGALNSNMTSDFKPEVVIWPKPRARSEKSPLLGENQRRTAKISTSYRKSMLLNPFPVTYLRPKVELMHLLRMSLLRMRRHYCRVWNTSTALDKLRVRLNVILFVLKSVFLPKFYNISLYNIR